MHLTLQQGQPGWRLILTQGVVTLHAGQKLGADGDEATAAAMRALRDEAKALQSEKAAKKAAFDAEYDVGELLLSLCRPCPSLQCNFMETLNAQVSWLHSLSLQASASKHCNTSSSGH